MSTTTDPKTSTMDVVLPWVGLLARLLVGVVWIVAGALKITDLNQSVYAVRAYQILPDAAAQGVGVVLPLIEIAVGLLLVLGLATIPSAAVSGLLLLAFIIGIISAWVRGLQIDCGCFGGGGPTEDPAYLSEILRDIGLLACCGLLMWRPRTQLSVDQVIFSK